MSATNWLLLFLAASSSSSSSTATPCFKLKGINNPCLNKTCASNARCVPSMDGKAYQCKCVENCWDVGDSDDSGPVCGSDAEDYKSECHLRSASCHAAFDVRVRYRGLCDPCSQHICKATMRCSIDKDRRPFCDCQECLSSSGQRVCGNDGRTYSDECHLRYESCRRGQPVSKLHDGECGSGLRCNKRCSHVYMHCTVSSAGYSQCICPTECPSIVSEVCGSDGRTYDSVCHLRKSACLSNRTVWPLLRGSCGLSRECQQPQYRCRNGGLCRMRIRRSGKSYNVRAECDRPECVSDPYAQRADLRVCGSDGVTYKSECYLRQSAFDTGTNLKVVLNGSCDACAGVQCPYYGLCRLSSDGTASCQCQTNCLYVYEPVCGSDGVTYELECDMRMQACKQRRDIKVKHQGRCVAADTQAVAKEKATPSSDTQPADPSSVNDFWERDD